MGVFWHTQGSGKSVSMMFLSQKILRKKQGDWTFIIVTDRKELDEQIYKGFLDAGIVTEKEAHAKTCKDLQKLLNENHRFVFTLIHKFRDETKTISKRENVIVIVDEAHRTQYDSLALNMRSTLPKASFIAFTGTPLISTEEKTKEVFGDYVSKYDFKQSVEDKATVPLFYENRIPELQIANKNLNEEMEQIIEEAELDEEQMKKVEREFASNYNLITDSDRLEKISKDIVDHFMNRGNSGKAMVICIDKATAIKMYNKVHKHWNNYLKKIISEEQSETNIDLKKQLKTKIEFMRETDKAVVVSQYQNEIRDMKEKGLDILPHRYPFLLIDRILDLKPGKKVKALKNVTINEPFFQGHFRNQPVMPGVLLVEAMAQAGGFLVLNTIPSPETKLMYISAIENTRFKRIVTPGDQLIINAELKKFKLNTCKISAQVLVDKNIVAESTFLASVVNRDISL